jgi:hypothetical protein
VLGVDVIWFTPLADVSVLKKDITWKVKQEDSVYHIFLNIWNILLKYLVKN